MAVWRRGGPRLGPVDPPPARCQNRGHVDPWDNADPATDACHQRQRAEAEQAAVAAWCVAEGDDLVPERRTSNGA